MIQEVSETTGNGDVPVAPVARSESDTVTVLPASASKDVLGMGTPTSAAGGSFSLLPSSLRVVVFIVASATIAFSQTPGVPQGGAPCATALDCSLGGECGAASSTCVCDAWWTGPRCDLLNLAPPVTPNDGLQQAGYFSWGGHALSDNASPPTYHGFFSFMCRHATLGEWTTKSSIWRATSPQPQGPFALAEMVVQPWSHNAMIARTNDAAFPYALYQIGDAVTDPSEWQPCFNASEASTEFAAAAAAAAVPAPARASSARSGGGDANSVYVRTAPTLEGPWTSLDGNDTAVPFIFPPGGGATAVNGGNPAPFFFDNGTVLMFFSANPCPPGWGNISPGNNCIWVARGESWRGPFTALPLPVTHPESEDAFVFRDPRGAFHLLTNVNNDHTRCAAGVPCGGHAWSEDGLTFSNLTIGAFGPIITFANGTVWRNAYVERPQVLQAEDGTPVAFYVGIGRSSYDDSASWAQLFCVKGQTGCGPTTEPPAPPPTVVQYARGGGACLSTNASFPCPGGWNSSCPTFLASCSDAAARWLERADGLVESQLHVGACLNNDCDDCAARTVVKVIACDSGAAFRFDSAAGELALAGCGGAACVDGGAGGAPTPPCKAGEEYLSTQLALAACGSADAGGWTRVVVA